MPLHGYSATTKPGLILDGGQLRIGNTIVSTTRGGLRFDPGDEIDEVDFDGRSSPIAGLDRVGFSRAVMSCTVLEASATTLPLYMPGATSSTAGGITTIAPRAAREFIAAQVNARGIWKQGGGKFLEIRFPLFVSKWGGIESADRSEGGMGLTIEARASDVAADIHDATYLVLIHDAEATLTLA